MKRSFIILILAASLFTLASGVESSEVSQKILLGAKHELSKQTVWDWNYPGGHYRISYPGGDIDSSIGVCVDVVIRSLRHADLDLQTLVHQDIVRNPSAYPRVLKPDANIDHRRCHTLLTFFRRWQRSQALPLDGSWQAGDIVFFSLKGNGVADHCGIVSDHYADGSVMPLVIHNYPFPGHVSEADLLSWPVSVVGHFRVTD